MQCAIFTLSVNTLFNFNSVWYVVHHTLHHTVECSRHTVQYFLYTAHSTLHILNTINTPSRFNLTYTLNIEPTVQFEFFSSHWTMYVTDFAGILLKSVKHPGTSVFGFTDIPRNQIFAIKFLNTDMHMIKILKPKNKILFLNWWLCPMKICFIPLLNYISWQNSDCKSVHQIEVDQNYFCKIWSHFFCIVSFYPNIRNIFFHQRYPWPPEEGVLRCHK